MAQKDAFLSDLAQESAKSRSMLARVPADRWDFKPHEKSQALGALAQHVANLPVWTKFTLTQDELDFAKPMDRPAPVETVEDLLARCDQQWADAKAVIEATTDEVLDSDWTMRAGDQIFFTRPKKEVLREFVFSHIIHHRAQLSVYLRLLDIPVPGMYGPTADER
jgi:uncharacterized damage-inducible protein DinB